MTTLSLVATTQPNSVPPRVKVDVTDSGSPAITSVNVVRRDAAGVTTPVRTPDGGPLILVTSGSNRVGTVYDYEDPFGQGVTYSTVEQPANSSVSANLAGESVWLIDPGAPAKSVAIDLRIDSFETTEFGVNAGVFYPMGRENPVVVSDGRRRGGTSSFTVGTETLAQLAALRALISSGGVLFLNCPPQFGLGLESAYIFVQDVRIKRRSNIGSDPYRDIEMPFVVVDRPVGGQQATYTYAGPLTKYASYQALLDANASYVPVLTPS